MRPESNIAPFKPRVASTRQPAASEEHRTGGIHIRDVVHRFADKIVIDRVSTNVELGEFVSIVGPSGCGKTTLLNLIAGLVPMGEGEVLVADSLPRAGRHDVAYMLARDSLLPWLNVQHNAEFGAEIRGVPKEIRYDKALTLLEKVGLKDFRLAYPKMLSHGMRQRVALARTFCLDAQILLMDEPFGALDAQTKIQLGEILLALWTKERRTVVLVTHDLNEAVALSDRVIVMSSRPGKIVADVTIDLPRPRSIRALQGERRYHELYAELWTKLEVSLGS